LLYFEKMNLYLYADAPSKANTTHGKSGNQPSYNILFNGAAIKNVSKL
jgi:hypothetical protein